MCITCHSRYSSKHVKSQTQVKTLIQPVLDFPPDKNRAEGCNRHNTVVCRPELLLLLILTLIFLK